jgi:putative membrane protein
LSTDTRAWAFVESWSWEPGLISTFVLTLGVYAIGWARLRRRANGRASPNPARTTAFVSGIALAWFALLSPISTYSGLFFFLHMTQHLLLVLGVVPLLLLANPLVTLLWGLPEAVRMALGSLLRTGGFVRWFAGVLTQPLVAGTLFVAALGLWHVPVLYDLAQGRTATHDLEHMVFTVTAALYWWPVIQPSGRRRLSYGRAVLYLMPPFLESNLIGALLTFASTPLYATYAAAPRVWELSVVQDQQLAGLVMWVPGGLYFLAPMLIMLAKAFEQEELKRQAEEFADEAALR